MPDRRSKETSHGGSGSVAWPEPCSCFRLRRSARQLTQAYDDVLRPCGLRVTQYSLLAHVIDEEGLSVTDLADRMAMDRTTLTRNLRPLDALGLVEISAGRDRRCRAVRVTVKGKRAYRKCLPLWQDAERSLRRQLGRGDTDRLHRLLDRLAESV